MTATQNQESYAERLLHAGASAWVPPRTTAHDLIKRSGRQSHSSLVIPDLSDTEVKATRNRLSSQH